MNTRNGLMSIAAMSVAIVLGAACTETQGRTHGSATSASTTSMESRGVTDGDYGSAKALIGDLTGDNTMVRHVIVNGERVPDELIAAMESYYRVHVPDGCYWYDAVSGAWGLEGGPTLGFTAAGMNIGGALRADASKGDTGVFINGRELHRKDVLSLNLLIAPYRCQAGRYWVDANGNFGVEHGGVMGNLVQIYQAKFGARGNGGGQHRVYDSGIGAVMGDGSGFIGYISGSSSATSW